MIAAALLIASVSVWDYPTGKQEDEQYRLVAPAVYAEGEAVALGGQNFVWDKDAQMMSAKIELTPAATNQPYAGLLYHNRDNWHSAPCIADFPGLSVIRFDKVGKSKGLHCNYPNALYPYPVFGNASLAFREGGSWRSIPRAMMTVSVQQMSKMQQMYLTNQIWVFPSVEDYPPTGTNGDQFASLSPYWLTSEGKSWSDQYYLKAALEITAALPPDTRKAAIEAGLLAPTVQTIIRRSLKQVKSEEDYFTDLAHVPALPVNGLDRERMLKMARMMRPETIAPVATVKVAVVAPAEVPKRTENIYATRCATAFALRSRDAHRVFMIKVEGGAEYHVVQLNHPESELKITSRMPGVYRIEFEAERLVGRMDIAIFAKSETSDWGAPSYLTFYRPNPDSGSVDKCLYPEEN